MQRRVSPRLANVERLRLVAMYEIVAFHVSEQRLPVVAARYTEIELLLALLDNDLAWLERTSGLDERRVLDEWDARLLAFDVDDLDLRERELLRDARASVRSRRPR